MFVLVHVDHQEAILYIHHHFVVACNWLILIQISHAYFIE